MTKKRKGFRRYVKKNHGRERDGLREKLPAVTSNWGSKKTEKKVPAVKSNWGSKKAKAEETAERFPRRHRPSYDVRQIKIADIKIKGERRALNPEKLNGLMQSIPILSLQNPITVRLVKRDAGWGKTKTERHLVTGFHRLEATKQLGKTTITCVILKGGKRIARLWEISENLHRAELTPFEHDEQVAEWVRLTESDPPISGQNVQKKGRGRRKGGVSEAARRLPIKGKTHTAKRKNVERALKVDSIFAEAKDAIKKAGLDQNRSKYRKVAAEKTLEAQLAKVRELTAHKSETAEKGSSVTAKQRPLKVASEAPLSAEHEKVLESLTRAFTEAPPNVQQRFISMIHERFGKTSNGPRSTPSHWV